MSFEIEKKDRSYATVQNVLRSCFGVLSNRDHSVSDLREKQIKKGYDEKLVDEAIQQLIKDGYLNDELFAQGYFNSRINRGHGPIRIRQDMRLKKIPERLIDDLLSAECDEAWKERAVATKIRKFGEDVPHDRKWQAKVSRFLAYRGYTGSHIREALNPNSEYI